MQNFQNLTEKLKKEKLIVILRNLPKDAREQTVAALYRAGVRLIEVTFNPSLPDTVHSTAETFAFIKANYPDVTLAAGTVVKPEYVRAAKEMGAEMIVSPHTDKTIIELTHSLDMMSVPGAFTPTEIMNAYNAGADIVKIFPIEPHNIPYLKNILSPLSHVPFMTTGGVNADTAAELLQTGAVALAAGASVITTDALQNRDYAKIEQNAKELLAACKG